MGTLDGPVLAVTLFSLLAACICWIVYWVRLGNIRAELIRAAAIL